MSIFTNAPSVRNTSEGQRWMAISIPIKIPTAWLARGAPAFSCRRHGPSRPRTAERRERRQRRHRQSSLLHRSDWCAREALPPRRAAVAARMGTAAGWRGTEGRASGAGPAVLRRRRRGAPGSMDVCAPRTEGDCTRVRGRTASTAGCLPGGSTQDREPTALGVVCSARSIASRTARSKRSRMDRRWLRV